MDAPTGPLVGSGAPAGEPVAATAAPRAHRARGVAARVRDDGAQRVWWGAVGVALTLAAIELVARSGLVARRYFPPPTEVAPEMLRLLSQDRFWSATRATLDGWAMGFGIAAGLGLILGVLLGAHPLVRAFTASTVDFLRPVPSVAFIPVVVLLFGTEIGSKVSLVAYAAVWPVLIQVVYGITDVDPVARDTARSLRLGPIARMRHLVWPSALPYALTGVRLAASVALVVGVAAELIIGNPGLGNAIASAKEGAAFTRMYALIAFTGIIGVTINAGLGGLQRWALRHYPPDRAGRAR
ncbi:MAG: ABC transporter permease [Thermoleophilia bacterium]